MIIKRVLLNKKSKLKYVVIPKASDIKAGDYIEIVKIDSKQKEEQNDRNTGIKPDKL